MCEHSTTTVKLDRKRRWEWCSNCGAVRNANPEWGNLIRVDTDWQLPEQYKQMNRPATKHDLDHAEARLSKLIISAHARKRVRFDWVIGLVTKKTRTKGTMEIRITTEQQVRVTLAPKTDSGKPAKLDGAPAWTTISGSSQVNVDEDGLGAMLVSSDDPGDTEIMVKADADLGEGVEEISDIIKLSVVGATAKNLGLVAGTPELKPTA